jgi:hypothetical protein
VVPLAPTADVIAPPATQRFLAWGTASGAVAFLGGAIAAQLVHEQNASRYNDDSLCKATTTLSRDQRCGTYRGRAETAQTLANIGYVAAGALGVASAVLFFTAPPQRGAKKSAIYVDAQPGAIGVGWIGTL